MPIESIEMICPSSMHRPVGFSHVVRVRAGKPVFIAGQVALDAAGNVVGRGNFRAQARQVFENLKNAVEGAGGSFSNVAKLNIYVVDVSCLPEYREIRDLFVDVQ